MNTLLDRAQALSERLVAARTAHRRAEHALATLLTELVDDELFRPLGYISLEDYAACTLELTARQARDLVRIGRALPYLPRLSAALEAGALDWTKARELVRVATAETEEAWIRRAHEVPSRILEREVAACSRGDSPPNADDPRPLAPPLHTFVARMESADADTLRAAIAALRFDLDADADALDDGALLARIAEQWLRLRSERPEGATPISGERYRVVLEHCPTCGTTQLPAAELSDTIVEEAACDAEVVDLRPGPAQGHVTRTVPPATRRLVIARAKNRCEVPNCRNRLAVDIHHVLPRAAGGTHDPSGLVCICDGHHRVIHRGYMGVARRKDGGLDVWRGPDGLTCAHVGHDPVDAARSDGR